MLIFLIGKSKAQAKSAAAEAVIRYIFIKRVKKDSVNLPQETTTTDVSTETQAATQMEVDDEEDQQMLFSWSHIASFALHKLLSSWDEGGTIINAINGNVDKVMSESIQNSMVI